MPSDGSFSSPARMEKESCIVRLSCTRHSPFPEKVEQILVDLVLVCRAHAVRRAFVDVGHRVLEDLGREHGRGTDRHDLVVGAMKDQGGHVHFLEILGQIRLGNALMQKYAAGKPAIIPWSQNESRTPSE